MWKVQRFYLNVLHILTECLGVSASSLADRCGQYLYTKYSAQIIVF